MRNRFGGRWLYHLVADAHYFGDFSGSYSPPSLAAEGFIHCSYRPSVLESARLYFPAGCELRILQIDPRRLDVPVQVVTTPRGDMPHVHGPLGSDAVVATLTLDQIAAAPDAID